MEKLSKTILHENWGRSAKEKLLKHLWSLNCVFFCTPPTLPKSRNKAERTSRKRNFCVTKHGKSASQIRQFLRLDITKKHSKCCNFFFIFKNEVWRSVLLCSGIDPRSPHCTSRNFRFYKEIEKKLFFEFFFFVISLFSPCFFKQRVEWDSELANFLLQFFGPWMIFSSRHSWIRKCLI